LEWTQELIELTYFVETDEGGIVVVQPDVVTVTRRAEIAVA
jgi:hypothetical protein